MPYPDVESDVEMQRSLLSMRTKVFLIGTCFLLGLGTIAYVETPYYVNAVRAIMDTGTPPFIESSPQADPVLLSPYVTLFMDDFDEERYWVHWEGDKLEILSTRASWFVRSSSVGTYRASR